MDPPPEDVGIVGLRPAVLATFPWSALDVDRDPPPAIPFAKLN